MSFLLGPKRPPARCFRCMGCFYPPPEAASYKRYSQRLTKVEQKRKPQVGSHFDLHWLDQWAYSSKIRRGMTKISTRQGWRVNRWICWSISEWRLKWASWIRNCGNDQHFSFLNFLDSFLNTFRAGFFLDLEIMESESFTSIWCAFTSILCYHDLGFESACFFVGFIHPLPKTENPGKMSVKQAFPFRPLSKVWNWRKTSWGMCFFHRPNVWGGFFWDHKKWCESHIFQNMLKRSIFLLVGR